MKIVTLILTICLLSPGFGKSQRVTQKSISPEVPLVAVNPDNKFGFIDIHGNIVITPKYEYARDYHEGLAVVRTGGKWGFIDTNGKMVIEAKFDCIHNNGFSQGLAAVVQGDPEGKRNNSYIDKTGNWVIKPQFDSAEPFSENTAPVKIDKKYGLINRKGEYIVPPRYANLQNISEGLAAFQDEPAGKWGYIDLEGKQVIVPRFDYAHEFSEGLAEVTLKGKSGFIDKKGKIVIPIEYDFVDRFSEGLASVSKDKKDYFIDKRGKVILPPELAVSGVFVNGLACGGKNGKFTIIDKTGKKIAALNFFFVISSADAMEKGLIPVVIGRSPKGIKSAFVNLKGKIVYQWEFSGSSKLLATPCASEAD